MTSIQFSTSQSIPPRKFTDSPTTTVPIPNWLISPQQYKPRPYNAKPAKLAVDSWEFFRDAAQNLDPFSSFSGARHRKHPAQEKMRRPIKKRDRSNKNHSEV